MVKQEEHHMANEVRIKLTEAQRAKIKSATGKVMTEIRVGSVGNNPAVSTSKKSISARAMRDDSARVASARALRDDSTRVASARAMRDDSTRVASARALRSDSMKTTATRALKSSVSRASQVSSRATR